MKKFCNYCKKTHDENELCEYLKTELCNDPGLLSQAVDFTCIAGQYRLTTSQDIANITQKINQVFGTSLAEIEGSHQVTRDIQVFKRLNEETYRRLGIFQTPEMAKQYLENAAPKQLENLSAKLSGSGQEVDWLREQQGKLRLLEKNVLLNGNAPGVDGETVNRLTGELP